MNRLEQEHDANEIAPGVTVTPPGALRLQYSRSAGPGGQNVNKLSTKAELWLPMSAIQGLNEGALLRLRTLAGKRLTREGEIHLVSQTERSQEMNRMRIFERLRDLIEQSKRAPKLRRKTKPPRAAKTRRLESKRRRGEIKAKRQGAISRDE